MPPSLEAYVRTSQYHVPSTMTTIINKGRHVRYRGSCVGREEYTSDGNADVIHDDVGGVGDPRSEL
jgi:hypothetical protein